MSTHAHRRLFCLPYAGGGASIFRKWASLAPPTLQIAAIQLPGREHRLAEPAYVNIDALVAALIDGIRTHLDRPFAIFGHSMGALIAFEVARALRRQGMPQPLHLFFSSHRAPHLPDRRPPLHALPEDEFWPGLRALGGTPDAVLDHPELMALVVPLLRADFQLCETYAWREEPPLELPFTIFGGREDPNLKQYELDAWRNETTAATRLEMLPGDHYYLHHSQQRLMSEIERDLAAG